MTEAAASSTGDTYASLRTRAIESLLIEKGYLSEEAVDVVVEAYENDIGPLARRTRDRARVGRPGVSKSGSSTTRRRPRGSSASGGSSPST